MDGIILIIYGIVLLIIIGIFVYFIIDYFKYKDSVDSSIKISTDDVNNNFNIISSNIIRASGSLDNKYNNITNNLQNSINKDENRDYINSSNLNSFDSGLKKYFDFVDNNNSLINEKIFNHTFTSINPNLNLISRVNALSGMTVKSSTSLVDNKNFRICESNNNNNCINLNMNEGNFSITPENNTHNIYINSADNKHIARFDMLHSNIYLGKGDDTAPLFINENNVYVKKLNIIKDPSVAYDAASKNSLLSSVLDMNTINNMNNINTTLIANYTITTTPANPLITINIIPNYDLVTGSTLFITIPEVEKINNNNPAKAGTNTFSYIIPATQKAKVPLNIPYSSGFIISTNYASQLPINNITMVFYQPPVAT